MSKKQYAPIDPKSIDRVSESLVDIIRQHRTALTAEVLADLLSMSQKHIYELAKKGRIPSYRIGGAIRFDPYRVAEWLEGKAVT